MLKWIICVIAIHFCSIHSLSCPKYGCSNGDKLRFLLWLIYVLISVCQSWIHSSFPRTCFQLIWLVTFVATICLDVPYGLITGLMFSLLTVLYRTQVSFAQELAHVSGTELYVDPRYYVDVSKSDAIIQSVCLLLVLIVIILVLLRSTKSVGIRLLSHCIVRIRKRWTRYINCVKHEFGHISNQGCLSCQVIHFPSSVFFSG